MNTITITCTCSSQLEVDESFAGKTITCPDCQRSMEVPAAGREAMRTSGFALSSLVFALVGAFTIAGTIIAIVLGITALLQIRNQPDRLAGRNFAWAGIFLGAVLTGLSLFAWSSAELFGLDSALRHTKWLGKVDYTGSLIVKRTGDTGGFEITRPSRGWGVLRNREDNNRFAKSTKLRNVLLVHPGKSLYVMVLPAHILGDASWDACEEEAKRLFRTVQLSGATLEQNANKVDNVDIDYSPYRKDRRRDTKHDPPFLEFKADKTHGMHTRTYLIRIYKNELSFELYVVAGGTEKERFDEHELEIRKVMDSFRIVRR